jgi:hypothetical protein
MKNQTKSSSSTAIGAAMLLLTVIIRHSTGDSTAHRWADYILPALAFVLIGLGIRYNYRARKESPPAQ